MNNLDKRKKSVRRKRGKEKKKEEKGSCLLSPSSHLLFSKKSKVSLSVVAEFYSMA